MSPESSPTSLPVTLASQSRTRIRLLQKAGLSFDCENPRIDEQQVRLSLEADGVSPRDIADALADLKAAKVSGRVGAGFIIGSDQVLGFNGKVFGKSETPEALEAFLNELSGHRHTLFSAVVVYERDQPVWRHIGEVRLTMHELSPQFIRQYVDRNWEAVRHSAGGYHIEEEGVALFSRIDGSYFDILGLPLPELLSYLRVRKVFTT